MNIYEKKLYKTVFRKLELELFKAKSRNID